MSVSGVKWANHDGSERDKSYDVGTEVRHEKRKLFEVCISTEGREAEANKRKRTCREHDAVEDCSQR
eukprot:2022245-Amphidinium_carterae.1